jgi:CubicO group peptidase (beta-lactamase class C family)
VSASAPFKRLIEEAAVPGMAVALIEGGRLRQTVCCGVRSAYSSDRIDEHTVFDAASLTKPVFAHVVLQLTDGGYLSLDTPLSEYLPNYVPRDKRASTITARHVLSHTGGFPNWRSLDFPLKTYFEPGAQFSYSGEGYLYLQKSVEAITGQKLHTLAEELVFQPFGMTRSTMIWDARLDGNRAYPHDDFGRPALGNKPGEANAAWSLQTTVADFTRFLVAVLDGERLSTDSVALWLRPHIEVNHRDIQLLSPNKEPLTTGVAWGLGWGLEQEPGTFFQWGDNGAFKSFAIGSTAERRAVVVFTNGASGLSVMPELLSPFIAGARPSLAWLDYVWHDAPVRRLLREARARGIEAVWPQIESVRLDADELRWIARGLEAVGREEDATWLREQSNRPGVNK